MDVTSDEIRSSRFQGTRYVYDRREIDAFLHRAAATLEMYERKLAVTQAHVESLEKALDLAHNRARALQSREARIAELEAALAAAQHNLEAANGQLEAHEAAAAYPEVESHTIVVAARARAEEITAAAEQRVAEARKQAEGVEADATEAAARALATAQTEADELLELTVATAKKEADRLLEEAMREQEQVRLELAAAGDEERAQLEAARDEALAAADELRTRLEQVERKAAQAESRGREQVEAAEARIAAAEAETAVIAAEVGRLHETAEAERVSLIERGERMAREAASRAADTTREMMEAEWWNRESDEVAELRRQLARMRTTLGGIQQRLGDAANLAPHELELAAALVEFEMGADVVDLTAAAEQRARAEADAGEDVVVKSRWAERERSHAVAVNSQEDAQPGDVPAGPTWRDRVSSESNSQEEPAEASEALGFYERRLAGLRARLGTAMPRD